MKNGILQYLNISSFEGYKGQGLIVIDNYETIDENEKEKINDFIEYGSPIGIQYIITSRQEEPFAERHCLKGFNDEASCSNFLSEYIKENSMVIELSDDDKRKLFEMSKGNTLVLVLCLKRLDLKLDTISGINADLSKGATLQSINKELTNLPANGYEIISEYMFKNTFGDIEKIFSDIVHKCKSGNDFIIIIAFDIWNNRRGSVKGIEGKIDEDINNEIVRLLNDLIGETMKDSRWLLLYELNAGNLVEKSKIPNISDEFFRKMFKCGIRFYHSSNF